MRLLSLDTFRGIAIAGMILVNNPGSWSTVYWPLLHAEWHGATPTDWVFPFFLFAVGMAIPLSLGRWLDRGDDLSPPFRRILVRSVVLFGLGLLLAAFPNFKMVEATPPVIRYIHYVLLSLLLLGLCQGGMSLGSGTKKKDQPKWVWGVLAVGTVGLLAIGSFYYDFSRLRVPGVLQRIALVYGLCSVIFVCVGRRWGQRAGWWIQLAVGVFILLGYWALLTLVPVPDSGLAPSLEAGQDITSWIDRTLIGTGHLWSQSKTWDPEGIASTLPAIVTGISGMLTMQWLQHHAVSPLVAWKLIGVGAGLIVLSLLWHPVFPINKALWTSSYVCHTSGIALVVFGICYGLVEVRGWKKWAKPFIVYGSNALFVFVLSGLVAKLGYTIRWTAADGATISLQKWVYQHGFVPFFSDYNASLAYALANVLLFLGLSYALYRRKIYIRV